MCTRQQCIDRLTESAPYICKNFGVKNLCIFGSVARGDNRPDSDVDICVDMPARMSLVLGLKIFLEELFGSSVDLVLRSAHRPGQAPEERKDSQCHPSAHSQTHLCQASQTHQGGNCQTSPSIARSTFQTDRPMEQNTLLTSRSPQSKPTHSTFPLPHCSPCHPGH